MHFDISQNHLSAVADIGKNCFRSKINLIESCGSGVLDDGDNNIIKQIVRWTVVVAQLVERSLPNPEVRSSNPVNGKKLY